MIVQADCCQHWLLHCRLYNSVWGLCNWQGLQDCFPWSLVHDATAQKAFQLSPELMMGSNRRRIVSMLGGSRLCTLFNVVLLNVVPCSQTVARDSTELGWPWIAPKDSSSSRAASRVACSVCWCCSWTTRVLACFKVKACALKALSRSATKLCRATAFGAMVAGHSLSMMLQAGLSPMPSSCTEIVTGGCNQHSTAILLTPTCKPMTTLYMCTMRVITYAQASLSYTAE